MRVSIILPVYNKSKYLLEMLNDIKEQTFDDFECIIIDDGSSDGSENICDIFCRQDARFQVFHIQNHGVSHARNVGLRHARGDLITFVDADDRLDQQYLENLCSLYDKNNVDMVISDLSAISGFEKNEKRIAPILGKKSIEDILPHFVSVQRCSGIYGFCVAKIFSRHLISNISFDEDLKLYEDFDFYLKVYERINTIYFDDKALYFYHLNTDNSSTIVNDYDIDYLAQLTVRLREKTFLERMQFYYGENKRLLDKEIQYYIYFVLFYIDMSHFDEVYYELKKVVKKYDIKQLPLDERRQRKINSLFWHDQPYLIKKYIQLYRAIRAIVRR